MSENIAHANPSAVTRSTDGLNVDESLGKQTDGDPKKIVNELLQREPPTVISNSECTETRLETGEQSQSAEPTAEDVSEPNLSDENSEEKLKVEGFVAATHNEEPKADETILERNVPAEESLEECKPDELQHTLKTDHLEHAIATIKVVDDSDKEVVEDTITSALQQVEGSTESKLDLDEKDLVEDFAGIAPVGGIDSKQMMAKPGSIEIPEVLPSASRPLGLLDFFEALHMEDVTSLSCEKALSMLIGDSNFKALRFSEEWENDLLQTPAELHNSIVEFVRDDPFLTLSAAQFSNKIVSEIEDDTKNLQIGDGNVALSWTPDNNLTVTLSYKVGGQEMTSRKDVENAVRVATLEQTVALNKWLGDTNIQKILASVLGGVLGGIDLVSLIPVPLAERSFDKVKAALGKSEATCLLDDQGKLIVQTARILCHLDTAEFAIAGGAVPVSEWCIRYDSSSPSETLKLEASGTIPGEKETSISLESVLLPKGKRDITVRIMQANSLRSIMEACHWPHMIPDLSGPFNATKMEDLTGLEDIILLLEPIAEGAKNYQINHVVATIRESHFMDSLTLPITSPLNILADVVIRIEIKRPLNDDERTAIATINFNVGSERAPISLIASLAPRTKQYAYRLVMNDTGKSLSTLDFAKCLGLKDILSKVSSSAPGLETSLEKARVSSFAALLLRDGEAYTISNWKACAKIGQLLTIQSLLTLDDIVISLTGDNDSITCNAHSNLILHVSGNPLSIPITLPELGHNCHVRFATSEDLSVTDIAAALELPVDKLKTIPVADCLLHANVVSAELAFCCEAAEKAKPYLSGGNLTFKQPQLSIGELKLFNATHTLLFEKNTIQQGLDYTWLCTAPLGQKPLHASLTYGKQSQYKLQASIQPDHDAVAIADLLDELLPGKMPVSLSSLLETATFVACEIILDSSGHSINYATIDVHTANPIKLQNLNILAPKIFYRPTKRANGAPTTLALDNSQEIGGDHIHNNNSQDLEFVGVAQKGNRKATVKIGVPPTVAGSMNNLAIDLRPTEDSNLTALDVFHLLEVGPNKIALPTGDFEFLIKSVTGSLTVDAARSLGIDSLQIVGESAKPITLPGKLPLRFDLFRLNAHFKKGSDLVVEVIARLVLGGLESWMAFAVHQGVESYRGEFDAAKLDVQKLSTTIQGPSSGQIPKLLGLPSSIPLEKIQATYTSGKALELIGLGTSCHNLACAGVMLKFTDVGVHFQMEGSATDAYLTGKLNIPGFLAAQIRLQLSEENAILTTVLQAAPEARGKGLELLTNFFGQETGSTWASIVPATAHPMSFDGTGVALRIDFAASKIIALGTIFGVGEALLIVKPKTDRASHGYYLSFTVRDIKNLWPKNSKDIASFNVSNLMVEVLTFETTVRELKSEVQLLSTDVATKGKLDSVAMFLAQLPSETSLSPRSRLSATVTVEGNSDMTKALRLVMDPTCKPTIWLQTQVAPDLQQSKYEIEIRDLYFIGGKIRLNGKGNFTPANKLLAIDAVMVLTGLTEKPISFAVDLKISPDKVEFQTKEPAENQISEMTSEKSTQAISGLFNGKMFNVQLVKPQFSGTTISHHGKTIHTQTLTAGVRFGDSQVDPSIRSCIIFDAGKPKVASVEFQQPLTLEDVFNRIVSPKGMESRVWPVDFPVLQLSNSMLYFSPGKDKLQLNGLDYLPGYHFRSRMTAFGCDFDVVVDLPENRKGIVLSGSYSGIMNLGFLQIKSPGIHIDTTGSKATYTFQSSLSLFGVDNLNLSLEYRPNAQGSKNTFAGLATYKGKLFGIDTPPPIPFSFDGGGFGFSNLGVSHDGDEVFDLAESICKASEVDQCPCGKMTDLKFSGVKTKFNFSLSFEQGKTEAFTKLAVKAMANCALDITVAKKRVTSIQLGALELPIAAPFKKEELIKSIINAIKESAIRIGKSLLERPEDLAKIIALMNVDKYSKQVTQCLICRKVRPKNLIHHAEKLAEAETTAVDLHVGKVFSLIPSIPIPGAPLPGGLTTFMAASAALEAAQAPMAAVGAAGGLVGILLGAGLTIPMAALGKRRDKTEKKYKEAEAILAKAKKGIEDSLVLKTSPTAKFLTKDLDDTVEIDWSKSLSKAMDLSKARVSWALKFATTNDFNDSEANEFNVTNGSFTCVSLNPKYIYVPKVFIWIRARVTIEDKHTFTASQWSKAEASHIAQLHSPKSVKLMVHDESVSALRIELPQPCGECQLQIIGRSPHGTDAVIYDNRISFHSKAMISVPITDLRETSAPQLQAALRRVSSNDTVARHSSWIYSTEILSTAAPPTELKAKAVERNINASWKQSGPATEDFVIQIYREDGRPVQILGQKLTSTQTGKREIELTIAEGKVGQDLFLQVHAKEAANIVPLRAKSHVKIEAVSLPHQAPAPESIQTSADSKQAPIPTLEIEKKEATTVVVSSVDIDEITEERTQALLPKQKKNDPAVTVASIPPIIQNGDFSSGDTRGWVVDCGENKVEVVTPGFGGSGNKVVFTIPQNSSGSVWLFQCLSTEEGKTYKLKLKGMFKNTHHNEGYCTVSVDGQNLLSVQSTGHEESVWVNEAVFTAHGPKSGIALDIAATWGKSMIFELGGTEIEEV